MSSKSYGTRNKKRTDNGQPHCQRAIKTLSDSYPLADRPSQTVHLQTDRSVPTPPNVTPLLCRYSPTHLPHLPPPCCASTHHRVHKRNRLFNNPPPTACTPLSIQFHHPVLNRECTRRYRTAYVILFTSLTEPSPVWVACGNLPCA